MLKWQRLDVNYVLYKWENLLIPMNDFLLTISRSSRFIIYLWKVVLQYYRNHGTTYFDNIHYDSITYESGNPPICKKKY